MEVCFALGANAAGLLTAGCWSVAVLVSGDCGAHIHVRISTQEGGACARGQHASIASHDELLLHIPPASPALTQLVGCCDEFVAGTHSRGSSAAAVPSPPMLPIMVLTWMGVMYWSWMRAASVATARLSGVAAIMVGPTPENLSSTYSAITCTAEVSRCVEHARCKQCKASQDFLDYTAGCVEGWGDDQPLLNTYRNCANSSQRPRPCPFPTAYHPLGRVCK